MPAYWDTKSIPLYKYIGESSRSCHERGWEHWQDAKNLSTGSHILKHLLDCHDLENLDLDEMHFNMRVVKYHKSAFSRQVHESVVIQANRFKHYLLNSKAEFNRCALPRLGLKMGDKEFREKRKEQEEEKRKDEHLEEKIRLLKRERGKNEGKRRAPQRYSKETRKKLRLDSEGEDGAEGQRREIHLPRVEKRKDEIEDNTNPGKSNNDIRKFFTSITEGGTGGMEKHENENFDKQKAQNVQQFEKKKFRKQINQNILSKVNVFEGEKDNKK